MHTDIIIWPKLTFFTGCYMMPWVP